MTGKISGESLQMSLPVAPGDNPYVTQEGRVTTLDGEPVPYKVAENSLPQFKDHPTLFDFPTIVRDSEGTLYVSANIAKRWRTIKTYKVKTAIRV